MEPSTIEILVKIVTRQLIKTCSCLWALARPVDGACAPLDTTCCNAPPTTAPKGPPNMKPIPAPSNQPITESPFQDTANNTQVIPK